MHIFMLKVCVHKSQNGHKNILCAVHVSRCTCISSSVRVCLSVMDCDKISQLILSTG